MSIKRPITDAELDELKRKRDAPLECVRRVVAHYLVQPYELLTADTRLDDLVKDDLLVIGLMTQIEAQCGCDIPDYQITTLMTLAQLAILVEENRKT